MRHPGLFSNLGRLVAAGLALGLAGRPVPSLAEEIVRISDLDVREDLRQEPFQLQRSVRIQIRCEGAGDGEGDAPMYAYGWILDARTREVVWALTPAQAKGEGGRQFVFDGEITLPSGDYVAGYAAFGQWRANQRIFRIGGKEIARIEIDKSKKRQVLKEAKRWGMTLAVRDNDASAVELSPSRAGDDGRTVLQMTALGDNAFEKRGFTLKVRTRLTVYCLGEFDRNADAMADVGFILDAATRKQVWVLGPANYKHAGGATKNKMARETITLPQGDYVAYFATDDSHSPDAWNAPPPYDPDYWGLTVWAESAAAAARIQEFDDDPSDKAMVSIVRQRNDAYETEGLRVVRPIQVRVYTLGERDKNGAYLDRGWIEDFKTHRRVWEMTDRNSQPAGGNAINRFSDEIVTLGAGDYVVYYVTDQGHAFEDWHGAPPHDPEHWGITLYAMGRFDPSSVKSFDPEAEEEKGKNYLARMVRLGDDEEVSHTFRLSKPTRVRIVALGEGSDPEMSDYGWIENKRTGQVVWEMTWRNTRWAGGAPKNRMFDGVVLLDAGEYEVHFVTDGSHAWGQFNAPHPDNPPRWGISVTPDGDVKR